MQTSIALPAGSKYGYFPYLNKQAIQKWVNEHDKHYHPFGKSLLHSGGMVDISNIEASYFLSTARTADLDAVLAREMQKYPAQLGGLVGYETQRAEAGQQIVIPNTSQFAFFTLTNKINQYFDMQVLVFNRNQEIAHCLTYSARSLNGEQCHSGDIGQLLQTFTIPQSLINTGFRMVIAVVGYNRTKLTEFIEQNPFVCLVNRSANMIWIVPCSLSQASIGNACLSCLASFEIDGNNIVFKIPRSQYNVGNVNTGEVNELVRTAGRMTLNDTSSTNQTINTNIVCNSCSKPLTAPLVCAQCKSVRYCSKNCQVADWKNGHNKICKNSANGAGSNGAGSNGAGSNGAGSNDMGSKNAPIPTRCIVFRQNGIMAELTDSQYPSMEFGNNLWFIPQNTKPHVQPKPPVILPIVFGGLVSGDSFPALGGISNFSCSTTEYEKRLNDAKLVIVRTTDGWLDTVQPTVRGNGLFIYHSPKEIGYDSTVENILLNLTRNVFMMAGSMAILLVKIGQRLYWYRGVQWKGLIDIVPNFGTDVTELFSAFKLASYVNDPTPRQFRMIQHKGDNEVFYEQKYYQINQLMNAFESMSFDQILAQIQQIFDILTQVSILLNQQDLTEFKLALEKMLVKKMSDFTDTVPKMSPIDLGVVMTPSEKEEFGRKRKEEALMIKQLRDQRKNAINRLIDRLTTLSSEASSSTMKKQSLKADIKKQTIMNNVESVKNKTDDELIDDVDEYTEKHGAIFAQFSHQTIIKGLDAIRDKNVLQAINDGEMEMIVERHPKNFLIECCPSSVMATSSANHPLQFSGIGFMIPTDQYGETSAIMIMLVNELVMMKTPMGHSFERSANENPAIVLQRIKFSDQIGKMRATRNHNIDPTAPDIRLLLCWIYLNLAKDIVSGMSKIPDQSQFDDVTCKSLRAILGHLFSTMASGNRPLMTLYQLLHKNSRIEMIDQHSWVFLTDLVKVFPYACYTNESFDVLRSNVCILLVKAVCQIAQQCTKKMTESTNIKKIDTAKRDRSAALRNKHLVYHALVVEFVMHYLRKETKPPVDMVRAILAHSPTEGKYNSTKMINDQLESANYDWDILTQLTLNIFVKRSAFLARYREEYEKLTANKTVEIENQIKQKAEEIKTLFDKEFPKKFCGKLEDITKIDQSQKPYQVLEEGQVARSTPNTFDPKAVEHILMKLLESEPNGSSSNGSSSNDRSVSIVPMHIREVDKALRDENGVPLHGAEQAIELADQLDMLTLGLICNKAPYPIAHIEYLFNFVGINSNQLDRICRKLIEISLINWRDTVMGKNKGCEYVMSQIGVNEEVQLTVQLSAGDQFFQSSGDDE